MYPDFEDDFDAPIAHRGPVQIFSARHPLGNPAEVEGFLYQSERWVAKSGPMDIADMEPEHALNAANMVLENALRIAVVREAACIREGEPVLDPTPHFDQATSLTAARAALVSTPLIAGLMARAAEAVVTKPSWAR